MLYLSLPEISYLAFFVVKNRERQSAAPIFGNRGDERVFIRAREQIGRHFRFHFAQKFRYPRVYLLDKIERNGEKVNFPAIFEVNFDKVGKFFAARDAPRRPEINEQRLAAGFEKLFDFRVINLRDARQICCPRFRFSRRFLSRVFCLRAGVCKGEKRAKTYEEYDAEKFILRAARPLFC